MKKNNKIIIICVILLIAIVSITCGFICYSNMKEKEKNKLIREQINEIKEHYNEFVITNKKTNLYNNKNEKVGIIEKGIELLLDPIKIDHNTKYFIVKNFDKKYYINYKDVNKIEKITKTDDRYKNYIVFNENVVTGQKTAFYNESGEFLYEFDGGYSFPIIVKENEYYGVEYDNKLVYIKKDDVIEVKTNKNTNLVNSSGVAVLNYHAFYDENNAEEKRNCSSEICHSKKQFREHLELIKNSKILTLKMDEYEKYIDGKIQLPKSVLITIDDGGRTAGAIDLLTEYKMYATIFLITSWFDLNDYYYTEFIEFHSHTHDMHNAGICPGGQGGGIKCLPRDTILSDLKTSREELNGTKALCYPFYEYNNYSIELAKEAGFTLGFAGESYYSDNLTHVGANKFELKRFVITIYTSLNDLKTYFNQIKS